jgi:peptide-methionine (S)-S-oxide reductase
VWTKRIFFSIFGLGFFWDAERLLWQQDVVLAIYEPEKISYEQLFKLFWKEHNPTQGNDISTQYRSATPQNRG